MIKSALFLSVFGLIPCLGFARIDTLKVGNQAFQSITEAIAHTKSHDVILVEKGIYDETDIVIDKPLTLIGVDQPVVDGQQKSQIFLIQADSVTLSGFQIQNVGKSYTVDWAGIKLDQSQHCLIEDNVLVNTFFGIYLKKAHHNIIRNNDIAGKAVDEVNSGNGIHLWYSNNNLVEGNHIRGHRDGIYFEFVDNSRIINNTSEHNLRYGLHFMFSNNDQYIGNTFRANGTGVAVMFSKKIKMNYNHFLDNWGTVSYALLFKEIYDGELKGNEFRRNTTAIFADGSNRIDIAQNNFTGNGWAMNIYGNCFDNKIRENNFISNTFDIASNNSKNHNTYEGNYWDQYAGYDLDLDGYGDVPYRPVKLFSFIQNRVPESIILLRSFFIEIINIAERVTPVLTPEDLIDKKPKMKQFHYDNH